MIHWLATHTQHWMPLVTIAMALATVFGVLYDRTLKAQGKGGMPRPIRALYLFAIVLGCVLCGIALTTL
jgi:hypothetical protein